MSVEQDELALTFAAVSRAEISLRDAIRLDFGRVYGPLWMSRVPEVLRNGWEQRQRVDETRGLVRGPEPIEYADIADLSALVARDWDVFATRFGERQEALAELDEFRAMRNAVMHSGARLSPRECQQARRSAETVLKKCTTEITIETTVLQTTPAALRRDKRPPNDRQLAFYRTINQALSEMSGLLTGERDAVVRYLRQNLAYCSAETVSVVLEKFARLPGTRSTMEELYRSLPPAQPTPPPAKNRPVSDWLKWADTQYIPYRRWLIRARQDDDEVTQMSLAFEDWLASSYPMLLRSQSDSLVVSTYKTILSQLNDGFRVLWLVVDNLCGFWRSEFQLALEQAGPQIRKTQRTLAMLPSSTMFSRRSMLAGRLPALATQFQDEERACRDLWSSLDVPMAFCTAIEDVHQAIEGPARLIIYVDNWIDTLAHMPDHPGFNQSQKISQELGALALMIAETVHKMQQIGPTRLVVSTDHGCTRPGQNSAVIPVPPSAVVDIDPEEHYRYLPVDQVEGLNATDWHILEESACGLPQTVAVTRGQRYINRRPRAYVHGGLSPEETVVSHFVADAGQREALQLVLAQATPKLRRGRPGQLAILVHNPFDMPAEDITLSLPQYGITFASLDVPARTEKPTEAQSITLESDLEVRNEVAFVRCSGTFVIAGQSARIWEQLRLEIQELYRPALDDLGDMFDG